MTDTKIHYNASVLIVDLERPEQCTKWMDPRGLVSTLFGCSLSKYRIFVRIAIIDANGKVLDEGFGNAVIWMPPKIGVLGRGIDLDELQDSLDDFIEMAARLQGREFMRTQAIRDSYNLAA